MNDTELRSRLQGLVDPPLAPRPSRVELEDRIARRTRRRRVVMAAAAALVLVVASAFAVSGWPWTRGPGYVQVDDPTPAQSEASQPSDKDPSEMTDAELAAELDRMIRSSGQMADGVVYFFGLGAELLGGEGDPRGVDTWWHQTSVDTPAELAADIDEYVADGLGWDEFLDKPGYLEGEERTVALLRELADRLRNIPPPQRSPYPYQGSIGGGQVPVAAMAGYGDQRLIDVVALGDVIVAVGDIGPPTPRDQLIHQPAVLLSAQDGGSWEQIDVMSQGMEGWRILTAHSDGQQVVVGGSVDQGSAESQPAVAVSNDGRTWRLLRFPDGDGGQVNDVTVTSDGTLVAVGWQYSPFRPAIWTSSDMRTLTPAEMPGDEGARVQAVAPGPHGLVAVGNEERDGHPRIWRSTDATSWTVTPASEFGITGEQLTLRAIDWMGGYVGGSYVMRGTTGRMAHIWTSSDGNDWTPIDVEPGGHEGASVISDVTVDGRGRLLAVGARYLPDERRPRPAWWTQTVVRGPLEASASTDTEGIALGVVTTGRGVVSVGVAYPPDVDGGDGVIWDLAPNSAAGH